jgi:hypothetical protein
MMQSATYVVPIEEFDKHATQAWDKAWELAFDGLQEPLRAGTKLTFCRCVDVYDQPMDSCARSQGQFAVCMVTAKDLGPEPVDVGWYPLCDGPVKS